MTPPPIEQCIKRSVQILKGLRRQHRHWSVAWSGGKDSTLLATLTAWAIEAGHVERPETFCVIRSDTTQELAPLELAARRIAAELRERGIEVIDVRPEQDKAVLGQHSRSRCVRAQQQESPLVYATAQTRPDGRVRRAVGRRDRGATADAGRLAHRRIRRT